MPVQSKSKQVERILRSNILGKRWRSGTRLPTERELAERYGVSRFALREALNALVSDGLILRRQGSGTFVAEATGNAQIAVVGTLYDLTSAHRFFARGLIDALRSTVQAEPRRVFLAIGHGDDGQEIADSIHLLDANVSRDVSGVLAVTRLASEVQARLSELRLPFVTIDSVQATSEYSVVLNYQAMVERGIAELGLRGIRDFAVMTVDYSAVHDATARPVFEALTQLAMNAVGGRTDRVIGAPQGRPDLAYGAFKQWWRQSERPDVMFFFDDVLCDMASRAVLELGLRVPDQFGFLTQSSTATRFVFPSPVTALEFNVDDIAARAWRLLSRLTDGKAVERKVDRVTPEFRAGDTLPSTG